MIKPCQRMLRTTRRLPRVAVDLWEDAGGAVAIEYGLIAALIAVAILGTLVAVHDALVGLPLQSLVDAFVAALS